MLKVTLAILINLLRQPAVPSVPQPPSPSAALSSRKAR